MCFFQSFCIRPKDGTLVCLRRDHLCYSVIWEGGYRRVVVFMKAHTSGSSVDIARSLRTYSRRSHVSFCHWLSSRCRSRLFASDPRTRNCGSPQARHPDRAPPTSTPISPACAVCEQFFDLYLFSVYIYLYFRVFIYFSKIFDLNNNSRG